MTEWIMLFSLGFVTAFILALIIINRVKNRTERLTIERLESTLPQSKEEIQAGKDQLRAEFAIANRRLEVKLDKARERINKQLEDIGQKDTEIHELRELIAIKHNDIEEIQKENLLLEENYKERSSEFEILKSESTQLSAAYNKLINDHKEAKEKYVSIAHEKESLEQINIAGQNKINNSLDSYHNALNELQTTQNDLRVKEKEYDSLKLEFEQEKEILVNLKDKLSNAQAKITDLEHTQLYQTDINSMSILKENETIITKDELESLNNEIESLRIQLNNKSVELNQLFKVNNENQNLMKDEPLSAGLVRNQITQMAAQMAAVVAQLDSDNGPIMEKFEELTRYNDQSLANLDNSILESNLLRQMRIIKQSMNINENGERN